MDEAEIKESEKTDGKQAEIKKPYLFQPGQSGNPNGRPKGSFSPLQKIKQKFEESPELADEWLDEYLKDAKNRQHLFNQIEGMPKQRTEITGDASLPFIIKIIKDGDKDEDKGEGS